MKPLASLLFALIVQPGLRACPICFQVEQGPTTDGVRAAVFVLLGVTTCVLAAFGAFVVTFARRS